MNIKLLLENISKIYVSKQDLIVHNEVRRESLTDALQSCTGPNLKSTGGSSSDANVPRFCKTGQLSKSTKYLLILGGQ